MAKCSPLMCFIFNFKGKKLVFDIQKLGKFMSKKVIEFLHYHGKSKDLAILSLHTYMAECG